MCQIIVKTNPADIDSGLLNRIVEHQSRRSGDWFWTINEEWIIYKNSWKYKRKNIENFSILHGRKATVGTKNNIDLLHPFLINEHVYLFQNWTLCKWENLKLLMWITWASSDTEALSKILISYEKDKKKWRKDIVDKLDSMSSLFKYGILIFYNKKHKNVLLYTDGERELSFRYNPETQLIELITNYNNEYEEWDRYIWHVVFDTNWIILENNLQLLEGREDIIEIFEENISKKIEEKLPKKYMKHINIVPSIDTLEYWSIFYYTYDYHNFPEVWDFWHVNVRPREKKKKNKYSLWW